jgi:chloramphenicol 3-O phosphotransferase
VRSAVIVLNGASSSGKSSIALELQGLLPRPFLAFGVDTLVAALPPASPTHDPGIVFGSDGVVAVGDCFRQLEHAWYQGLAAIARDDVGVIIDEVFLGGRESQDRLCSPLGDLRVMWVGVRCDLEVAIAREVARPETERTQVWPHLRRRSFTKGCSTTCKWTRQPTPRWSVQRLLLPTSQVTEPLDLRLPGQMFPHLHRQHAVLP